MATRAIIKVEGVKYCSLYKHWDGYPEGTLNWLKKFNADFIEHRGDDPSYKMAQLIRSPVSMASEFGLDESPYTGWGVFEHNCDCGQDYKYMLKKDGSVLCNEVVLDAEDEF